MIMQPRSRATPWPSWRYAYLVVLTALCAYGTALGWFAQLVMYPLFRAVPAKDFGAFHSLYNRSIPAPVIVLD